MANQLGEDIFNVCCSYIKLVGIDQGEFETQLRNLIGAYTTVYNAMAKINSPLLESEFMRAVNNSQNRELLDTFYMPIDNVSEIEELIEQMKFALTQLEGIDLWGYWGDT